MEMLHLLVSPHTIFLFCRFSTKNPTRTTKMPSRPISANPNHSSILKPKFLFLCIIISASALFFFALIFLLFYLWYFLFDRSRTSPFDSSAPLKLQRFSYRELKLATNLFNDGNSIGKGGSGTVFRGILRDGKSVAVKKLDSLSLQAEREFQNELQILSVLRSPFVVSLLGFCAEKKRRFLVYEYMPNRSLQESLFGEGLAGNLNLNWDRRFEIVLDVARALEFLHLECDPPVIHGDIKPSNVLLGSDYRAKLSDFGLSRVKTEGELGVELFSHELGRSQELWKSQDLNGIPVVVATETPTVGTPVESSTTEVDFDFALALQGSSSSKNSKVGLNVKNFNSNSLSPNSIVANVGGYKCCIAKGKEASAMDIGGDDWNKFVPYDDELCSVGHSKELKNLNGSSLPIEYPTASAKQWGKDWWWRQDGSGELCSKDYVMEWIGSQISPSGNSDWNEEKKNSPEKLDLDTSTQLDKLENTNGSQVEELGFKCAKKRFEKKEATGGKICTKRHRKMQEWWKEEHLAEISKKHKKLRKLKANWRKGFKISHFDLGRRFRSRSSTFEEQNQKDSDPNMEFSFRKGWKKRKTNSTGSEMWSGDLFSRELSSTTSMRGTVCYVAPEYGGCGYLMEKADIYSLGVLILVTVSGRRPLHVLSSPMKLEKANLISWCRQLAHSGNVLELVDERLKDAYNKDQANLCINLALMCLQKMPELRPDIGEIVKILNGEMDLPALPFEFSPSPPSKLFCRSRRRLKADVE